MGVTISEVDKGFSDWQALLDLLHEAFEFQNARINPPSSLYKLDVKSIAQKARDEKLFLAWQGKQLVGCVFARKQQDSVYIGKLAIKHEFQGLGIGKQLMAEAQGYAKDCGYREVELQVRIELIENQKTFTKMGFTETQRTTHAGFSQPTSVTMNKLL